MMSRVDRGIVKWEPRKTGQVGGDKSEWEGEP